MSVETMLAKTSVRVIAMVIGVLLLGGAIWGGKAFYDHYQALKAKSELQTGIAQGTEDVSAAATTQSDAAASATQHTVEVRTRYITQYEELRNEDPSVRAYDTLPVPMRLRRLQCERAAARDGLTGSESGCSRFVAESDGGGGLSAAP